MQGARAHWGRWPGQHNWTCPRASAETPLKGHEDISGRHHLFHGTVEGPSDFSTLPQVSKAQHNGGQPRGTAGKAATCDPSTPCGRVHVPAAAPQIQLPAHVPWKTAEDGKCLGWSPTQETLMKLLVPGFSSARPSPSCGE